MTKHSSQQPDPLRRKSQSDSDSVRLKQALEDVHGLIRLQEMQLKLLSEVQRTLQAVVDKL